MTEHETPVEVRGLTVRYGATVALADVDLTVGRGSVYALLGRNGAGKSSLVRCLLGQQRPASGSTRLLGHDGWRERRQAMARVGVVPETPDAPPAMTARRLDAFGARLHTTWNGAGLRARLEAAEIPLDTPFGRLSRGQRAQVALALALAAEPEVLVLDDPTLGLDAVARRQLLAELVGELADRGTTVLLTSHDLVGMEAIADRVGMLRGGHLVVNDELEALKARFRRIVYRHRGESAEPAPVAAAVAGGEVVLRRRTGWQEELVVAGGEPLEPAGGGVDMAVEPMSLEEIFVAVCGGGEGGEA